MPLQRKRLNGTEEIEISIESCYLPAQLAKTVHPFPLQKLPDCRKVLLWESESKTALIKSEQTVKIERTTFVVHKKMCECADIVNC